MGCSTEEPSHACPWMELMVRDCRLQSASVQNPDRGAHACTRTVPEQNEQPGRSLKSHMKMGVLVFSEYSLITKSLPS